MIRKNQSILNCIYMALDACLIFCAYLIATYIRFDIMYGARPALHLAWNGPYFWAAGVYTVLIVAAFYAFGLYGSYRFQSQLREMWVIFSVNAVGVLAFAAFLYFTRIDFSRLAFSFFYVLSTLLVSAKRVCLRAVLRHYRKLGYNQKHVVVVGAGDTSADCIATAIRQGAASVTQLIRKPQALVEPRDSLWGNPIPFHDYAEDEAVAKFGASPRQYETVVDHIETNEAGKLVGVVTAKTRWTVKNGKAKMEVLEEGKTLIPAGLLLIASGFSGCEKSVLDAFGLERTKRGVAAAEDYATANPQVFVAGDMRRGPSLVVWAIAEGRAAAQAVDAYLLGYSNL